MSLPMPGQNPDFKTHPIDILQQHNALPRCWDPGLILTPSVKARDSRRSAANSKGAWARVSLACGSPWHHVSKKKHCLITHPQTQTKLTHARAKKRHIQHHVLNALNIHFLWHKAGKSKLWLFCFPKFLSLSAARLITMQAAIHTCVE